ncbi:unnamed protein product, partial [marine sediment metagenome]
MARVIKDPNTKHFGGMGGLAALNIANFAEQSKRMVVNAQNEAARILARVKAEVEQMEADAAEAAAQAEQGAYEQGAKRGYAAGHADGLADGAERAFNESLGTFTAQTAHLQNMLTRSIEQLDTARQDVLQQARDELLDLSLTVAERITYECAKD